MMYCSLFQAVYLSKFAQNYSVVDTLLEHITRENWSTLSHSMSCRNIKNEGKSSRFFWIFFLHKSADNEEVHIHKALTEEGEAKSCLTVQNYEESHILMGNINWCVHDNFSIKNPIVLTSWPIREPLWIGAGRPQMEGVCKWGTLIWILGWFSNRTGMSVDNGARKSNNWLDQ